MKLKGKLLLGALALGGVFAVASCGGNTSGQTSTTPATPSTTQTDPTSTQSEVMNVLAFMNDNTIYFDNQLAASEGIKLKSGDTELVKGSNTLSANATFAFEGTTENKLYIYIVGMAKDGNKESYTFMESYGLNASTEKGMNVGTSKLNLVAKDKTKVFVSVSTSPNAWDKTLSDKLNTYITNNSAGSLV